jgi:exodeoxyribonuclease VIII
VSKSGLDLIAKAPALYHHRYLDTNKPKEKFNEAFLVGGAFHTFVLEPELLAKEYIVMPGYYGTGSMAKKQAFKDSNPYKKIISNEVYVQIYGMTQSVLNHPIASQLFKNGFAEQSFTWVDEDTDMQCKIRPDYVNTPKKAIIDLKSTVDASLRGFKNSAFKFRYDVQAAFYTDGMLANDFDIDKFIFVAVEKKPPYLVNVFYADADTLNSGRTKYKENLETYSECLFNDEWEGYDNHIKSLEIYL